MKKSIGKNLLCILLVSIFLFPLIGNSAMATDIVTCPFFYIGYYESECWCINPDGMVGPGFAGENRHCITQHLDELEPVEEGYEILEVNIIVLGYHVYDNEALWITPVFNNMTEGNDHCIYLPEGYYNADWSDEIDITDDLDTSLRWTWGLIENLDCHVTTGCSTEVFNLYVGAVVVLVTFIVP